ncbi:MAG TPA: squalene--hopene cyclase [Planctomycetaceae bacterium]|nr:squalene--hopene cyclase [Planctomycetaceae bacterium]HCD03013.1 squalene--hopene cyclase [Planctomycetaceae bacterium]
MTSGALDDVLIQRLVAAERVACEGLLAERVDQGTWVGQLSTSALSTATATLAIDLYIRSGGANGQAESLGRLVEAGRDWLLAHQNDDGGWGDTVLSFSNISTTMLAHATLTAVAVPGSAAVAEQRTLVLERAARYIERVGGVDAVLARYGRDRTFSVPILTHCALAGLVDWRRVIPLPFELAAVPHRFFKTLRLPVVSYALPALIAIGLVRFHARRPRNPLVRMVRWLVGGRVLRVLESIQPSNGGFLEAAPLTSFVTMSLVGCGLVDHAVTRRGIDFLADSVREDGSWPIDSNLATWVTTLSANALGERLSGDAREPVRGWLLGQQYREVHPYTNADPGGWSWTDLPGGVPDVDDTPGAVLALLGGSGAELEEVAESVKAAADWLLSVQNRDGGWPTFCRGWGTLPFDRSSSDITAHTLRALMATAARLPLERERFDDAIRRGFNFLRRQQRDDGAWVPLWFGNQHANDEQNPVYGTARVLAAWRAAGLEADTSAVRGREWLAGVQNFDGGWGGDADTPSSVEETALAVEALLERVPGEAKGTWTGLIDERSDPKNAEKQLAGGIEWLIDRVETGTWTKSSPIGFYFARLWYFEKLYPLIFTVAALRRACLVAGVAERSPTEKRPAGT